MTGALAAASERTFEVYCSAATHCPWFADHRMTATSGILCTGPQGDSPGQDPANLRVPSSLKGAGEVDVSLAAGGKKANTVTLRVR